MKVTVLKPSGYCNGVRNAFEILNKARIENPNKQIYVFGPIIHNKIALEELKENNFIILPRNIDEFSRIEDESVVVFPAHGHTKEMSEIASKKKLKIYDAICPFIAENLKSIKESLKKDKVVLFFGKESHDETKSILSISSDIYLIDKKLLKNNYFDTNKNFVLFSQSTIKHKELLDIKNDISSKIQNIDTSFAKVCNATHNRQKAILEIEDSVDMIIVIGDSTSNNTRELYEIAVNNHRGISCVLIESKKDLDLSMIANKKHIVISSGASTPDKVIDDVVSYINQTI